MKVKIVCHGLIDLDLSDPSGHVEVPDLCTVRQALEALPLDRVLCNHVPVTINGRFAHRSETLHHGDELGLSMPAPGG
jgi:hypothetical protein